MISSLKSGRILFLAHHARSPMLDTAQLIATPGKPLMVADLPTQIAAKPAAETLDKALKKSRKRFAKLQRKLYADNRYAILLIFQAMDAAGKDSTIRAVTKGVNPAGFQVFSFKQPSKLELDHDFLWRSAKRLPERGRIGIFNRSYYEETLVVRVHPEYLSGQNLPNMPALETLWPQRFDSINSHEKHLTDNGTVVLKFWLNVSFEEQRKRLLSRLDTPSKNWKFSAGDLDERELWPQYMAAYEAMINATSTGYAPWHIIPADDKLAMRAAVAQIIVEKLQSLNLQYPLADNLDEFDSYRAQLAQQTLIG